MRAHTMTDLSSLFSLARFRRLRAPLRSAAIAVALALGLAAPALAQQAIVQPGFAAVTGFGGTVANPPPSGGDPADYITDNLNGPSARVVDLTTMGPQGTVSNVPKPFTVFAQQVGQVFGVTLDDAPQPNIYVAATSAYGLSIAIPDASGQLQRVHTGAPGAQFVPGQFGPQTLNGGPGSIWKVDGVTGQVTLFANIDGGVRSVSGLGALAYDRQSRQIFASERGTGVIYRIALNGAVAGTYDHGTEGRTGAGLGPVAQAPSAPVDIQSPAFDTGNPQTWGVAAPARRTYALAVRNQRLYYSVAQGPQVWSAPIGPGGVVSGSGARVEVDVPSLADGVEITSIAFDGTGNMYLAERGATTGDYALTQLANPGQSRVLRFVPKPPGDPSPGFWRLAPDQYSIGLPPAYANANGGVALNYGYGYDGQINPSACGATLWSTGERLLDPGNGSTGFPTVDGLQGNDTSLFQPQNTPPTQSWFVDYDDQPGDPNFRGTMGAIATVPCGGAAYVPPPVYCPAGTYFLLGHCVVLPTCPGGTYFHAGECLYPNCPPNTYRDRDNRCVPPPQTCPRDSFYYNGRCIPFCPPELRRMPNGYCGCPDDRTYRDGRCEPPHCPPNSHYDRHFQGCVPDCRLGELFDPNRGICIPPCLQGWLFNLDLKRCLPPKCPDGTRMNEQRHRCEPICNSDQKYDVETNRCVPKCPPGISLIPGCRPPPSCLPGTQMNQDRHRCEPICNSDQRYDIQANRCVPKCPPGISLIPGCGPLQPDCDPSTHDKIGKLCLPKCAVGQVRNPRTLQCENRILNPILNPIITCDTSRNDIIGTLCLPKCAVGQVRNANTHQCENRILNPILNPIITCDTSRNDIIGTLCLPKCGVGQVRNPSTRQCESRILNPILNPVLTCDTSKNDLVGNKCLPKCGPDQFRARNNVCVDKNATRTLKLP